uniref:Uncharacterized protein n=1 Tax=Chromera velia CCMP2878 TaxID=1169474 RepID=A0A0G4H8Z6_9ALVE|mmetsp:Transcript_17912/g.36383  ORF Transcript_17912/g.36383 Transcript_17912/m.36383 type:complete len:152 (-) Transcript_17912:438-893(-)|eukprot:Cvel_25304.t1-p1 / transcript=Cvel_25304.t1 / gene=Cvel_25304 / organism=Chromera_velia_CCMP2878 / gene_product=hypothetical protein / transcript_product=hypothetical protein / location=Cvel_scaffold2847:19859-21133(-) / protein_length=151 / sequence_SO=supercontig / SO=protein_coding / is_pseudo=false
MSRVPESDLENEGARLFFGDFEDNSTNQPPPRKQLPAELKMLMNFIEKYEIPALVAQRQKALQAADNQEKAYVAASTDEDGLRALEAQDALVQEAERLQASETALLSWTWKAEAEGKFPEGDVPKEIQQAVANFNRREAAKHQTRSERREM